jgi:hypothetical protein
MVGIVEIEGKNDSGANGNVVFCQFAVLPRRSRNICRRLAHVWRISASRPRVKSTSLGNPYHLILTLVSVQCHQDLKGRARTVNDDYQTYHTHCPRL